MFVGVKVSTFMISSGENKRGGQFSEHGTMICQENIVRNIKNICEMYKID